MLARHAAPKTQGSTMIFVINNSQEARWLNRWFLMAELRFWSPFWRGRDYYSVQKIFSKRKRNSVLQNGNEVDMAMPSFCPFGRCELPYSLFLCMHESFILISSVDGIFRMKLNFYGMQWLQIPCTPVNVGRRLLQ